jgi:putative transposase
VDYETRSHSKYLIALHLILVVKYTKQLIHGRIGEFIKKQVIDISNYSDFTVEEIEIDKDHIHMLITIGTKYSIGQYVRRIKQTTNIRLWRTFPYLKNEFWREKTFCV